MQVDQRIEVRHTSSGKPVVSVNGRQTCSFVDPEKEAAQWIEHYRALLEGRKALVLLGLGSGYHVQALCKVAHQELFVIEREEPLVDHFKKHFSTAASRIQFFSLSEEPLKRMTECLPTPFAVLTFAPAIMNAREEYQNLFQILSGRETQSLNRQFQLRGVDHFFCPNGMDVSSPAESYRLLAKEQALPSRWKNLFKMMGDLIK